MNAKGLLVAAAVASFLFALATRAAPPPATQPLTELDESKLARRMAEAGDPRIIPVALYWLAAEPDGQPVGYGTARLRAAIYVVGLLRVREAVPLLYAAYDNPTAGGDAKALLGAAAIHLDPDNVRFCRDVLGDEFPGLRAADNPAVSAAAANLARLGDEAAADVLLDGYVAYLAAMKGDTDETNRSFRRELSELSDPAVRARVLALLPRYPKDPARNRVQLEAEQMRYNAKSPAELLAIARDAGAAETERYFALIALGRTGGADAVPVLERVAPWAAPFGATMSTTRGVATTRPAAAATATATSRPSTGSTEMAIVQLRRRHRLGRSPESPPPLAGLPRQAATGEGRVVRFTGVQMNAAGVPTTQPVIVREPGEHTAPLQFKGRPDLLARLEKGSPDGLLRLRLDAAKAEVVAYEPVQTWPGEGSANGYVLVETRTVRDGQTDRAAVVLGKFGRLTTARVPNRTRADGQLAPDRQIAAALAGLRPGDVVDARFERAGELTLLAYVAPYRPTRPAVFVRWTESAGRPAVELAIGRATRTYLLPEPRPGLVTVGEALRPKLCPGDELRACVEDDAVDVPMLRDLRVDGGIRESDDGTHVHVAAARANLQGDPRTSPFVGLMMVFGKGGELVLTDVGLSAVLSPRPGQPPHGLPPGVVARLAEVRKADRDKQVGAWRVAAANRLFDERKSAVGDDARAQAEQEIYLLLQHECADALAEQVRVRDGVRAALTPAQFRALKQFGAAVARTMPAAQPRTLTTRPAATTTPTTTDRVVP